VRENEKDEFVWGFETTKTNMNGRDWHLIQKLDTGTHSETDNGTIAKHCLLPRPNMSLVRNVEVFPQRKIHRSRFDGIGRKVKAWSGLRHAFGVKHLLGKYQQWS